MTRKIVVSVPLEVKDLFFQNNEMLKELLCAEDTGGADERAAACGMLRAHGGATWLPLRLLHQAATHGFALRALSLRDDMSPFGRVPSFIQRFVHAPRTERFPQILPFKRVMPIKRKRHLWRHGSDGGVPPSHDGFHRRHWAGGCAGLPVCDSENAVAT